MTDDQVRDVRDLTRKAGITPTTTRAGRRPPAAAGAGPRRAHLLRPGRARRAGAGAPAGQPRPGSWLRSWRRPAHQRRRLRPWRFRARRFRQRWAPGCRPGGRRRCGRVTRRWSQALRYGAHGWAFRLDHGLHLDLGRCRGVLRRHPRRFGPRRSLTPSRTAQDASDRTYDVAFPVRRGGDVCVVAALRARPAAAVWLARLARRCPHGSTALLEERCRNRQRPRTARRCFGP